MNPATRPISPGPVPPIAIARALSPRPFPLHLALAMTALLSSKAGLPRSNDAWPTSSGAPSPAWPEIPLSLAAELARFAPAEISAALDLAIAGAASACATGIDAYRRHPYRRADEAGAVVWRAGGASLIRHGAPPGRKAGRPALFAPSLLNRGWVLDLIPGEGMLSWLAGRGIDAYRIEWGEPGPVERGFGIGDYVRERLEPALDHVRRATGEAPVLVGYCMGGLLALAAALRRADSVRGLVLLATPWDFAAAGGERGMALAAVYRSARPLLTALGELPVAVIQALFTAHDPLVALRKFRRFAEMDQGSAEARAFVALEDWLNDGVALSLPAADEALIGWYGANATARGGWRIDGTAIDPAALAVPALVVVPGADRIVPPASAAAIEGRLPNCERWNLDLGHIGMVVGRRAPEQLWAPLAGWIHARFGTAA